jgi:glutamate-1-semialdehyde 2,1-aminomutase
LSNEDGEALLNRRNYVPLLAELKDAYRQYAPMSGAVNEEAKRFQVDGGSHALRLMEPFPPRLTAAKGAWVRDEDGHDILDLWQGHFANILGHNPEVVTLAVARMLEEGYGLQTGFTDRLQVEVAELLSRRLDAERIRFTTSGALATMYSIMLARAFTGRTLVMKVGGGWHGAQPWALKGIGYSPENGSGFKKVESDGVPAAVTDKVVVTSFNDPDGLRRDFQRYGNQLACFIVEPFLGLGGFTPARAEYLRAARELTEHYGVILIFDEVISGFRFCAGSMGGMYGVQPDLATLGKVVGGGMPVSVVAGRAEVMDLAGREGDRRVKFSGGTYSAHPASLMAAKACLSYLVDNEQEVYPRLAALGEKLRSALEGAFADEGIYARCMGNGSDVLSGSSMFYLHFPYEESALLDLPTDWFDPSVCDTELTHGVLDLALLLEDVFVLHGHGAVSVAHSDSDIDILADACRRAARRIKPYL